MSHIMEQKRGSAGQQRVMKGSKRAKQGPADTIFYGGDIITMDEQNSGDKIEAIAVTDGFISEVGSLKSVFRRKGPQTEVIFLNQQTLMPGFIEPHQHAIMTSQMKAMFTNISALYYSCYADIEAAMKAKIDEVIKDTSIEDKWALFFGWDPELIPDLPALSAKFLDDNFSSAVAIGVVGQSGHVAWGNTKCFEKAKINMINPDFEDPVGGVFVRDSEGNLTGQVLEEPAIMPLFGEAPAPSEEEMVRSVVDQWQYYASVGLTTVTELAYQPNEGFDGLLTSIATRDDCPIRLGLYRLEHPSKDDATCVVHASKRKPIAQCCPHSLTRGIVKGIKPKARAGARASRSAEEGEDKPIGYVNDKLWEAGIKLIADGSPHCGTAAIQEPFLNTPLTETLGFPAAPNYGILNFETDAFLATMKKLTQEGTQVAIHCHGERACGQIMSVYEQVLAEDPTNKCRHRMEHLGLMTVDQIARAGKINVALSFFVDHLRFYGSVYKTDIFGEERVNRWTPLSAATKSGVTWTIHQDHPTFPGDASPFSNIKTAVTRTCRDDPNHVYGEEYRVSIDEALKSYTINAAWQLHLDDQLGSITVGKKADLVVLSENPYHKDPLQMEEIKAVETFLQGRRNNVADLKIVGGVKVLQRKE